MNVIITETFAYSDAFIFVMENYVEMFKRGHCELSLCIRNDMNVTYMKIGDEVVSACVYELDHTKKQAWIYVAATAKIHRNSGYYEQVYEAVEDECRNAGMKVLNSNIHVDNVAMIQHAMKNDRELMWYRSRKYL